MTQAKAITTSLNKMGGVVPAKGRNKMKTVRVLYADLTTKQ